MAYFLHKFFLFLICPINLRLAAAECFYGVLKKKVRGMENLILSIVLNFVVIVARNPNKCVKRENPDSLPSEFLVFASSEHFK